MTSTTEGLARVLWSDVSGLDAEVDGYKVWRAAQYKRTDWIAAGMRVVDRYQHQHEVAPQGEQADLTPYLDPLNPYFDAEEFAFAGDIAGTYQPEEWGTYELVAKIPVSELSQYPGNGAYPYGWVDENSITGFTYWYYVSAYKDGQFSGPRGPLEAAHIESSGVVNRNGRNGCDAADGTIGLTTPWCGTYPFAYNNPNYPQGGTQAFKNFGAAFTVTPPVAPAERVADLITVSPNPYKETALNDVRTDPSSHNINFLNVPADFTITILDVAGQIVFQERIENADTGLWGWNQFSKDGIEVASGLYIYHVQYGDGQAVTGHFAILR